MYSVYRAIHYSRHFGEWNSIIWETESNIKNVYNTEADDDKFQELLDKLSNNPKTKKIYKNIRVLGHTSGVRKCLLHAPYYSGIALIESLLLDDYLVMVGMFQS